MRMTASKWIAWALFGNDEDGIYGDASFNPGGRRDRITAVRWWVRNPFHNLTFHVIGVPRPFVSVGDFPNDVFAPFGGWNRCVRIGANGRRYPFLSYIGRCKFYVGWRERGNFGIKLTRNR
ncbi:hypothetical protein Q3Y64_04675 [Uliginosibacterium sp. 31-12]|nr:hypothetical protein [Uliginosibacterium sp. 31-12]